MIKRIVSVILVLMLLPLCALSEEGDGTIIFELNEESEEDAIVFEPDEEIQFDTRIDDYMLEERAKIAEMKSILLIGIDARPREETGRSDTMIIVTLDPDNNSIKLTSLMRDLYVEIPGRKNNRINATYVFGGPELLMETIEANFGIHIDNYIAVNFSMLAQLIDTIGGLELTVESDYYKNRINAVIKQDNKVLGIDRNDGLLESAGTTLMTGKQAQAYARYRYGTKDGDFGRTARQREVITKIFAKLATKSAIELINLAVANFEYVYTNLSVTDIAAFAPVLVSMGNAEIEELRIPIDGAFRYQSISGMSVLVPNREKNIEALMEFIED